MQADIPSLRVYVGKELAVAAPLDGGVVAASRVFDETQKIILVVEPYEDAVEYQIRIGDVVLSPGRAFRSAIEWEQATHLDSARGRTAITLWSRSAGVDGEAWQLRAQIVIAVVFDHFFDKITYRIQIKRCLL